MRTEKNNSSKSAREPSAKVLGRRLREERERLGMSQDEFGKLGGVRRVTQYFYEQGDRSPSLTYLVRVAMAGADFGFLVLGERGKDASGRLCIHQDALITVYRLVDEFARDSSGRLLDLEHRLVLFRSLCNAVSGKSQSEVDWDALREGLRASRGVA